MKGLPHTIAITAGGKKGTFAGAFSTGNENGTSRASGSWTC